MVSVSDVDKYRIDVLRREWDVKSISFYWSFYKPVIEKNLRDMQSSKSIEQLGDNFRQVMMEAGGEIIRAKKALKALGYSEKTEDSEELEEAVSFLNSLDNETATIEERQKFGEVSENSRSQSALATVGAAMELLTSWYLNLIFWGTPVIVGKKSKQLLPSVLFDATTVKLDNKKSNSESDLFAFTIPNSDEFIYNKPKDVDEWMRADGRIRQINLSIIQTKTSWADNAQIPMLWNLIYLDKLSESGVKIGNKGVSASAFKRFTYAFITIPSQKNFTKEFTPGKMAVKRVQSLSGGNYWLLPTKEEVASAIHEFPLNNFSTEISKTSSGDTWGHVQKNLDDYPRLLDSFLNLNFDKMV